jgi:hypothetical protein
MIIYNNPEFAEYPTIEKKSYKKVMKKIIKNIVEASKKRCEPDY